MNQPIFDVRDSEEYARMREVLLKAEYHEKGLIDVLGPIQLPTRAGKDLPHFLHLTRAGRPLDILLRLFVAGAPVVEAAARDALAPLPLETWVRAGLVGLRDGMAQGRVRLLPCRGMVLACDYADSTEPGGSLEQVMGLTASSLTLADFRVPRPCRTTLDVGSGSGIQAFLAAPHSQQVWGVDCTRRSIEFARFNAGLNGIANCVFIEGNARQAPP